MKLRNKKTGKIQEIVVMPVIGGYPDETVLVDGETSLKEFNKVWEDYESRDPLIKDKKIRKVVRAWAEVNNAYDISYDEGEDCIYVPYGSDNTDTNICITFDNYNVFKGLEHRKLYTITELCGEGEE